MGIRAFLNQHFVIVGCLKMFYFIHSFIWSKFDIIAEEFVRHRLLAVETLSLLTLWFYILASKFYQCAAAS